MPQIRTAFSEMELALIDARRGGLQRGVWARAELVSALARMPSPVPETGGGKLTRLAINVSDEVKADIDRKADTVPVAQWARDAILRRLWASGARW